MEFKQDQYTVPYPGMASNRSAFEVAASISGILGVSIEYGLNGGKTIVDDAKRIARAMFDKAPVPQGTHRQHWRKRHPDLRYTGQDIYAGPLHWYAAIVDRQTVDDAIGQPHRLNDKGKLERANKGFGCDHTYNNTGKVGPSQWTVANNLAHVDFHQHRLQREKVWNEVYAPTHEPAYVYEYDEIPF